MDLNGEWKDTFKKYGVDFEGKSGDQLYGVCCFCGKKKFYMNPANALWCCKAGKCGKSGDIYDFLEEVMDFWFAKTTNDHFNALAKSRGLRPETLKSAGIAYNTDIGKWMIPTRDIKNRVIDIKTWKKGQQLISTPNMRTGLFGMENINSDTRLVYLCEGPWDTLAMREILLDSPEGLLVDESECLGSPGAMTFKPEWRDILHDKEILVLYDNDKAGRDGIARVKMVMRGLARNVRAIIWPEETPEGYDIRDLVNKSIDRDKALLWIMRSLEKPEASSIPATELPTQIEDNEEIPSLEDLMNSFKGWLKMDKKGESALLIMLAVAISVPMPGDPLWVFIVAPPGGMKTELLSSLSGSDSCVVQSTIRSTSLVSGWNVGGGDPSLLPKLNAKTLVIKDFTELTALGKDEKERTYSVLRGAYDGRLDKSYGNGIIRTYTELHFHVIAGATQDVHGDQQSSLGERFIKFTMLKGVGFDASESIRKALGNVTHETSMRTELAEIVRRFLKKHVDWNNLPTLGTDQIDKLIALSQLVAMLRGTVDKDIREHVRYLPQHEVGTRLAKQLKKLAVAIAIVEDSEIVSDRAYEIIENVALDTCTDINLEILSAVLKGPKTIKQLAKELPIKEYDIYDRLQDLIILGVIVRGELNEKGMRGRPTATYAPSLVIKDLWKKAKIKSDIRRR